MLRQRVEKTPAENGVHLLWILDLMKRDSSIFSQQVLMRTFEEYALTNMIKTQKFYSEEEEAYRTLCDDVPRAFGKLSQDFSKRLFGGVYKYLSEDLSEDERERKELWKEKKGPEYRYLFGEGGNGCSQNISLSRFFVSQILCAFAYSNGRREMSAFMGDQQLHSVKESEISGHVVINSESQGKSVLYGVGEWRFYIKTCDGYYCFSFLGKNCFSIVEDERLKNSGVLLVVNPVEEDKAIGDLLLHGQEFVEIGGKSVRDPEYVYMVDLANEGVSLNQFLASLFLNPYLYCLDGIDWSGYSKAFAYFMVQSVMEEFQVEFTGAQQLELQELFEKARTTEELGAAYEATVAAAEQKSIETKFNISFRSDSDRLTKKEAELMRKYIGDDCGVLQYVLSASYTEGEDGSLKKTGAVQGEKTVEMTADGKVLHYEYLAKLVEHEYNESGVLINESKPFVISFDVGFDGNKKMNSVNISVLPVEKAAAGLKKLERNGIVSIDSKLVESTSIQDKVRDWATEKVFQSYLCRIANTEEGMNIFTQDDVAIAQQMKDEYEEKASNTINRFLKSILEKFVSYFASKFKRQDERQDERVAILVERANKRGNKGLPVCGLTYQGFSTYSLDPEEKDQIGAQPAVAA